VTDPEVFEEVPDKPTSNGGLLGRLRGRLEQLAGRSLRLLPSARSLAASSDTGMSGRRSAPTCFRKGRRRRERQRPGPTSLLASLSSSCHSRTSATIRSRTISPTALRPI
jgi:hypothetical protein